MFFKELSIVYSLGFAANSAAFMEFVAKTRPKLKQPTRPTKPLIFKFIKI
jgi:hypothetical protein